jgi:hypothetical protein
VATFTLATHDLAFYNREQQFVAEAGLFNIQVCRPAAPLCFRFSGPRDLRRSILFFRPVPAVQVGTLSSSFTLTDKSLICPAI